MRRGAVAHRDTVSVVGAEGFEPSGLFLIREGKGNTLSTGEQYAQS